MPTPWEARLGRARSLPQVFEVVKALVRTELGTERAGLMLGLANLGGSRQGLVGGFYQVAGNMIVMNTLPLERMAATRPDLATPYAFHIMLHEYLHALGWLDEAATRRTALALTRRTLGPEHVATRLAEGWGPFMDDLVYPVVGWSPPAGFRLEVVPGFDADASPYIQ